MAKFNENYLNVKQSYLFSEIAKRVSAFEQANPDKPVIRLGIGDVTLPLAKVLLKAYILLLMKWVMLKLSRVMVQNRVMTF